MTLAQANFKPPMTMYPHIPVLTNEILNAFDFGRPATVVDGTLGLGGHSAALLARNEHLKVVGLEWDAKTLRVASERLLAFGNRASSHLANYAETASVLAREGIDAADGFLLDLGLSSFQLEDEDRGFSFLKSGPFDMRMSANSPTETAWDILNGYSEDELAAMFREYGEEPRAWRIAQALKSRIRAGDLRNDALVIANVIRQAAPTFGKRIDPATRCFQAFRIAVNHELDHLEQALSTLSTVLRSGGRAAIISFHSLEDRRVKTAFHAAAKGCECPSQAPECVCGKKPWAKLTPRKAIQATEEEIKNNPRARSAKLRILEKL